MFVPRLEPPPGPPPPLVRRVAIAQAALDKFRGQPFVWGKTDCARLAAFVLRAAGYKPKLARAGAYASDRAARRALKAQGFASMAEALDGVKGLARIAPLGVLPCDLIVFPGEDGWDGVTVALGNGRVLGFTEGAALGACSIIAANMEVAVAAWSVPPWQK